MRGRLFAGRLYAGMLYGAQAAPGIDEPDTIVRHYGGGMNGFAPGPATEVIKPRRVEHRAFMLDDDDLMALVPAFVMAITS